MSRPQCMIREFPCETLTNSHVKVLLCLDYQGRLIDPLRQSHILTVAATLGPPEGGYVLLAKGSRSTLQEPHRLLSLRRQGAG
jgi:hypothetical protein